VWLASGLREDFLALKVRGDFFFSHGRMWLATSCTLQDGETCETWRGETWGNAETHMGKAAGVAWEFPM
jgi:hypothetical protein